MLGTRFESLELKIVPRIRENYHRAPRIRKIGSLQVHTGHLKFSLKKTDVVVQISWLHYCWEPPA